MLFGRREAAEGIGGDDVVMRKRPLGYDGHSDPFELGSGLPCSLLSPLSFYVICPASLAHLCFHVPMHEISKALFRFLVATIRLPSYGMNLENITTLAGRNGASFAFLGS